MNSHPILPRPSNPPTERAASARLDQPRIPSWQLLRLLGRGERTAVYQARPLDKPASHFASYAVKVLTDHQDTAGWGLNSLCREAFLGQKLHCSNLVPVLSANLNQSPQFIVMPHLAGASLAVTLADGGKPALPVALWIARQVATALETLHSSGWLHGDIKPANVMIAPSGHATLIDLGFARRIHPITSESDADDSLRGTPCYMAPECFTSRTQIDPRSDLYSLGVMLYEMLSGNVPFGTQDAGRLIKCQLTEKPQDLRITLPSIPTRVSRLVKSLLAKSPDRRVASARELVSRLASLEIETFGERSAVA